MGQPRGQQGEALGEGAVGLDLQQHTVGVNGEGGGCSLALSPTYPPTVSGPNAPVCHHSIRLCKQPHCALKASKHHTV